MMQNIKPSSSDTTLLLRVLRIARPFKNLFWWSIALSILITPFSIAQPFIVQQIVDQHIVPGIKEGVLMLSLLYIVVLLINVVMKYFLFTLQPNSARM